MIVGIGVDLGDIDFFEQCLKDKKTKVIEETFTPQEIATAHQGAVPTAHRLAARFAAKEAFFKALSQTMLHRDCEKIPLYPKEIEVCVDTTGRPYFKLQGEMKKLADKRGVKRNWLTLTHEKNLAIAMVVLEG